MAIENPRQNVNPDNSNRRIPPPNGASLDGDSQGLPIAHKGKDALPTGTPKPSEGVVSQEFPLSKGTHTDIMNAAVGISLRGPTYDASAGEVDYYKEAVDLGRVDCELEVARQTLFYGDLVPPYTVGITINVFGEVVAASDSPDGEKVFAQIKVGIDHDADHALGDREAWLSLDVRENDTIGFHYTTVGSADRETTLAVESEFSDWGIDLNLADDPDAEMYDKELFGKGDLNEEQGQRLLQTLLSLLE